MKPTIIKYGVVGTGHIGKYHVQQALNIKYVNFIGVFDIDTKNAQLISKQFNVSYYNTLESLLKQCDAISLTTPSSTHFKIAKIALSSNCHVFIEKPITTNLSDAHKLIELSKKQKKLVQIGHIERFNPAISTFITSFPSCKPSFIEIHRLAAFTKRGTDTNVILDLMIHDIDLVLFLTKSSVINVSATGVNVLTSSFDLTNARIELKNGCVANITASRISDTSMRKVRIFEKKQYSSLDLQNHTVNLYQIISQSKKERKIAHKNLKVVQKNALYEELVSFVSSIQKNKPCLVGPDEGAEALKIALLVQKKINEQKK